MQQVWARYRPAVYLGLVVALGAAFIPLSTLTVMVLYLLGVDLGFESQDEFGVGDVWTLIKFLLIAVFIALFRAHVRSPREGVTGARFRVQGSLLVAECLGGGLLAAATGADATSAGMTGAGLSVLVTGFLIAGWLRTLPRPERAPRAPRIRPAPRTAERPPKTPPRRTSPPRTRPSRTRPPRSRPAPSPVSVPPAPHFYRGTAPAPGHVWFAEVPFEDGSGSKDRPCLVVRTFRYHAEVLKITSVDKSEFDEFVRMPVATWDPDAGRDSWLELSPLREVSYMNFRRHAGPCHIQAWRSAAQRHRIPNLTEH